MKMGMYEINILMWMVEATGIPLIPLVVILTYVVLPLMLVIPYVWVWKLKQQLKRERNLIRQPQQKQIAELMELKES